MGKACQELARVSGRARSGLALTDTSAQTAELVGAGRGNQEVADRLFFSLSTVEVNLVRIYRKLGVRSGTQLAARLQGLAPNGSIVRISPIPPPAVRVTVAITIRCGKNMGKLWQRSSLWSWVPSVSWVPRAISRDSAMVRTRASSCPWVPAGGQSVRRQVRHRDRPPNRCHWTGANHARPEGASGSRHPGRVGAHRQG
jgi:DNA-binding CsgD family transcriptional regulator